MCRKQPHLPTAVTVTIAPPSRFRNDEEAAKEFRWSNGFRVSKPLLAASVLWRDDNSNANLTIPLVPGSAIVT
jgi:hypothetical protein